MLVRVLRGPWRFSRHGFDECAAAEGEVADVPDGLSREAIACGDVATATGKRRASHKALTGAPENK